MIIHLTRMSYGQSAEDLRDADLHACQLRGSELFDVLTGALSDSKYNSGKSPVRGMWLGYEYALGVYVLSMGLEWCFRRGFAGTPRQGKGQASFWNVQKGILDLKGSDPDFKYEVPPWFRDTDVLASHRSNLARRDPITYGDTWRNCPENWPYLWPIIDRKFPAGYKLMMSKSDKDRLHSGERILPKKQKERVVNWP